MAAFVAAENTLGAFLAGRDPRRPQTAQLAKGGRGVLRRTSMRHSTPCRPPSCDRLNRNRRPGAHAAASRAQWSSCGPSSSAWPSPATRVAFITRHALRVEHEQADRDAVQSEITEEEPPSSRRLQTGIGNVQGGAARLRPRGRGLEPMPRRPDDPSCSWPIPAKPIFARCSSARRTGRRPWAAASCPPTFPAASWWADHDVPRQHCPRCLSQLAGPGLFGAVRPGEHRREFRRGLPRHGCRKAPPPPNAVERMSRWWPEGRRSAWRCFAPSTFPRPRPTATSSQD